MTPRLLQSIGSVVVAWSRLELSLINFAELAGSRLQRQVPYKIKDVLDLLSEYGCSLYPNTPEMAAKWKAFLESISNAARLRDSVSHGVPSTISHDGRTYPGLHIPPKGKKGIRVPELSIDDIERIADTIQRHHSSLSKWTFELFHAEQRLSPTAWEMHDGKWMRTADAYPTPDTTL